MVLPFTASNCNAIGVLANMTTLDLGPLAWPLHGYKNSTGGKASYGVRQPSVIVGYDSTIYLTWMDSGFDSSEAWVAASRPGPTQGLPGSFFLYNRLSGKWDVPALPPNFDPLAVPLFLTTPAPAASAPGAGPTFTLGDHGSGAIRLAGARLTANGTATGLYVAVYTTVNYTKCWNGSSSRRADGTRSGIGGGGGTATLRAMLQHRWSSGPRRTQRSHGTASESAAAPCIPVFQLFLRLTPDWVTWGPPLELQQFEAPGWDSATLQYATLIAPDGASTDVVDANGFYILATCGQSTAPCNATYGPVVTTAFVSVELVGG